MAQEKFDVGGMTCAACQAHVDRAVSKLDGVQNVAVNLLAGSMLVDYNPTQVTTDDICTAVDRAGYSASPVNAAPKPPQAAARKPGPAPPYGVADQKVGGRRLCHAHPSHHLNHLSHPTVLHRYGTYARLAAAQHLHRPHPQHDARPHRACPAHPHRLRQRRVLYQRLQITRARRAHHGCSHRRRSHRIDRLVALCHVYHATSWPPGKSTMP